MVKNSLNPDFAKGITVDYYFEMVQKLKFSVYDVDNETSSLGDDDFLGEMECTLGQVLSENICKDLVLCRSIMLPGSALSISNLF